MRATTRTRHATKAVEEIEVVPSKSTKKSQSKTTRNNVLKEKNYVQYEEAIPVKKSTRSRKQDENIIVEDAEITNKSTQRSKRNKKKTENDDVIEEPVENKKVKRTRVKDDEELTNENETVKNTRKSKKVSNDTAIDEIAVAKKSKKRAKNQLENDNDEPAVEVVEPQEKTAIEEIVVTKQSKKRGKNQLDMNNHSPTLEEVVTKQSKRRAKNQLESELADGSTKQTAIEEIVVTKQSKKRGKNQLDTDNVEPTVVNEITTKSNKRVKNKVETDNNEPSLEMIDEPQKNTVIEEIVVTKQSKKRGKNQLETNNDEVIAEPPKKRRGRNAKNDSDLNAETLPEQPNSPEVKKTRSKGKKTETIVTEDSVESLNSSYHSAQDTLVDSIKSPPKPDNISNMNETYDLQAANKSSMSRISGIEEIEMPSMIRDGTFIKNSTFDMSSSLDTSKKKTFSAASPCKLFKISTNTSTMKTPQQLTCRAVSVGSAGCTPMPVRKISDPSSTPMIVQSGSRFAEKKSPSMTRSKVFFRSPNLGTPENVNQFNSTKLIKSNLKGSNKSFMHTNSDVPRKRSLPQNDKGAKSAKIRKLNPSDLNKSVDRLSRPKVLPTEVKSKRTPGSTAGCTPGKPKPGEKSSKSKIRVPDFASVHKKQFDQMESLVDNKARKEERAKLLLSASKGPFVFTSKGATVTTSETASKAKGSLFNRFGFRVEKPVSAARKVDKDRAKDIVMRQEQRLSVAEKTRSANKEYIKGVRTNKRFELQMKNRNMQIPSN